jgi:hypothetical protein
MDISSLSLGALKVWVTLLKRQDDIRFEGTCAIRLKLLHRFGEGCTALLAMIPGTSLVLVMGADGVQCFDYQSGLLVDSARLDERYRKFQHVSVCEASSSCYVLVALNDR